MRARVLALVLAAAFAACARRQFTCDVDSLPVVGTVGDLPSADDVPVLGLDKAGKILLDGRTATLSEVVRALRRPGPDFFQGGLPDRPVVLEVPADVPWGVAVVVFLVCQQPDVARRPVFAVRDARGEVGGFVFDAAQGCLCIPPEDARVTVVKLSPSECGRGIEELAEAARADTPGDQRYVVLHPDPRLGVAAVLTAADTVLRAGVPHVQMVVDAAWDLRTNAAPAPARFCVVDRHESIATGPAAPLAPSLRIRGALVGVTDPGHWLHESRVVLGLPTKSPRDFLDTESRDGK